MPRDNAVVVELDINGVICQIPRSAADRIEYVRNLLHDWSSDEPIPLPTENIRENVIYILLDWCCHDDDGSADVLAHEEDTGTETWHATFFNDCRSQLCEVLSAAVFLGVEDVIEPGCKVVMEMIKEEVTRLETRGLDTLVRVFIADTMKTLDHAVQDDMLLHADPAGFEVLCKVVNPSSGQYKHQLEKLLHGNHFARSCSIEDAYDKYCDILRVQGHLSQAAEGGFSTKKKTPGYSLYKLPIKKLEFSPDQRYLYSLSKAEGSDGILQVWRLSNPPKIVISTDGVSDAVFGPRYLFVLSTDGNVRAWNVPTRQQLEQEWYLPGCKALVTRGVGLLAIGDQHWGGEPEVPWTWNGELESFPFPDQQFEGLGAAAFSSYGERMVFVTDRKITAVIPDPDPISSSTAPPGNATMQSEDAIPRYTRPWTWGAFPDILRISPLHDIFAIGINDLVLWRPKKNALEIIDTNTVYEDDVVSAEFSPDGRYLAAGTSCGFVIIWKVYETKLKEATRFRLTKSWNDPELLCITWSPDGQFIAVGFHKKAHLKVVDVTKQLAAAPQLYKERLVELLQVNRFALSCDQDSAWETYCRVLKAQKRLYHADRECRNIFQDLNIKKVGASCDLKYVYSLDCSDGIHPEQLTLRVWDLQPEEPNIILLVPNVIDTVFGGELIIITYPSGCVKAWNVDSGAFEANWELGLKTPALYPRGPGFLAMGKLPQINSAYTWTGDLRDLPLEDDIFEGASIAAFSSDGRLGAFAKRNQITALSPGFRCRSTSYAHKSPSLLLRSSHHGIVAAMVECDITLWWPAADDETIKIIKIEEVVEHDDVFKSAEFSPDGQFLAVGCRSGLIEVWKMHEDAISNIQWLDTGTREVGRGHHKRTGQRERRRGTGEREPGTTGPETELQCITWSADGRFLIVGFSTGAQIFNMASVLQKEIHGYNENSTEEDWEWLVSDMSL